MSRAVLGRLARYTRLAPMAVALAVAACGDPPDSGNGAGPEAASRRPNILLISLDALRADRLGCYGYARATSPFLDALAARGTRFDLAFVNTHGTPPSHATMFTSLYQETHRVGFRVDKKRNDHLPDGITLLPEVLREAGYATVGVTADGYLSRTFGFDRGFDVFRDRMKPVDEGAEILLEELAPRIDAGAPIFAFFHTYQIHSPYAPPPRYRELFGRFESDFEATNENLVPIQDDAFATLGEDDVAYLSAMYDGEIRFTDDVLATLFERLEAIGFFAGDHLIVITSDHGEEFGDHGGLLHRGVLYEEVLRVPLIMAGPRIPSGLVRDDLVSTIDLAPTIYRHAGLAPAVPMAGRALFAGDPPPRADQRVFAQYADLLYAVRAPDWKLIQRTRNPRRIELYRIEDDPEEREDLAAEHPEVVRRLQRDLRRWRRACPDLGLVARPEAELSEEDVERLRALGYLQ